MLHRSVLPNHARWARFLGGLRYVVIDEAHRYRGVFGAHVARCCGGCGELAHHYGADPVFIFASATIADAPTPSPRALAGVEDVVWSTRTPRRSPASTSCCGGPRDLTATAADLLAPLVAARGRPWRSPPRGSRPSSSPCGPRSARWRPGDDRGLPRRLPGGGPPRDLERAACRAGELRGVACTNALELGVDIAGMDAVVTPASPARWRACWQQVGRAGRAGQRRPGGAGRAGRPAGRLPGRAPRVGLRPPGRADRAASRQPLRARPAPGRRGPGAAADRGRRRLVRPQTGRCWPSGWTPPGALRRRAAGWFWTRPTAGRGPHRPALHAGQRRRGRRGDRSRHRPGRPVGGRPDPAPRGDLRAPGRAVADRRLRRDDRVALAVRGQPGSVLHPAAVDGRRPILADDRQSPAGGGTVHLGTVELRSPGHRATCGATPRPAKVWDSTPLDLPERTLGTRRSGGRCPPRSWPTSASSAALPGPRTPPSTPPSACCRRSCPATAGTSAGSRPCLHPDTGLLTVFVHDGQPGRRRLRRPGLRGHRRAVVAATLDRLASPAPATPAARPASCRPSAATATSRSTRTARPARLLVLTGSPCAVTSRADPPTVQHARSASIRPGEHAGHRMGERQCHGRR